jgi:phosphate:Na+ symporter
LLRKIFLPVILSLLGYALWVSADFKQIAAGVAIFLFGVLSMEEGFKTFTGGILDQLLRRTTDGPWKSLSFGILTTSVMQSSSLVSVIAISFLSAGLITLPAGIGIIFGANLGTTTGAWLIAGFGVKVKIAAYAMPMLVFGIILVLQQQKTPRGLGYVVTGLGFLFLGIDFMKEGFDSFRQGIDLARYALSGYRGLFTFVAIGTGATVVMQSSHATLVLTITALATGQLSYENALAVAIGANVGTTLTALIGSLGANVQGKRLAAAHLVFNLTTGLIAIGFIGQFVSAVELISERIGIAPADYMLKLAVFHSMFNLVGVALMMPFVNALVTALERMMPAHEIARERPRYLNPAVAELPDAAVEAARLETVHLLEEAFDVIARGLALDPARLRSGEDVEAHARRARAAPAIDIDQEYNRGVKPLYGAIIAFLSRTRAGADASAVGDLFAVRGACRHVVEAVKATKHLQKNLARQMASPNAHVRAQYEGIRIRLGEVLQQVASVIEGRLDATTILSLDDAKLGLREGDSDLNQELDNLIRAHRITPDTATSLMNDSHYAYQIGMHLIEAAQMLTSTLDRSERDAIAEMALDEGEVRGVAKESGETRP